MTNEIPMSFVDFLSKLNDDFHDTADSLPEYLGSTRNDFLTLVESDVADMPECKDILGIANTLVASYYLAAFTLHVGIPGVDIRGELDKFSVERSPIKTAIKVALGIGIAYFAGKKMKGFGRESYTGTLGAPGDYGKILALESYSSKTVDELYEEIEKREKRLDERERKMKDMNDRMMRQREKDEIKREREKLQKEKDEHQANLDSANEGTTSVSYGKQDMAKHLVEGGDLATGKAFDVTIERNGNKMPLTLNVSLAVVVADKASMKTILGVADYEYSFENRTMLASAGARSWIRDIALNRDLIDQMRKNRRADKTGFYKTVVTARNKNWLSGLISGNISVNNASSIIICTQETADEVEPILGGPISDFDVRQRLFKDTLTMLIFVVDKRWETVTIYHRGLNRATELDFRSIGRSKGGNKMDVDEIIRAYQAGSAPLGR